jgi:hypothetical protein
MISVIYMKNREGICSKFKKRIDGLRRRYQFELFTIY